MGKNALPAHFLPAGPSARRRHTINIADAVESRRSGIEYNTPRTQELTECQFWYVQGRFRR
jgi:hypothetical protein